MTLPDSIMICEVGPRDGLQNEKTILSASDKVDLINRIIDSGCKMIEVGSLVHPKAIPALADTEEVYQRIEKPSDVEFRVLVPNRKGVERAIKMGIKKVKLTVSVSHTHNVNNFNRTPQESLENFKECYALAKENGLEVSAALATAFGCPFEGAISKESVEGLLIPVLELGINEVSLSDTTGMTNPREVSQKAEYFLKKYPSVEWNLHFHNTRDMGFANVLAGMMAGVTRFDASFSGLGGCPFAPGATGNISTEDLIHMLDEMGIKTGINLDKSIEIAKRVEELVGHKTESYMLRAGKSSDTITLDSSDGQKRWSK